MGHIRVHRQDLATVGFRTWQLTSTSSLQSILSAGATRTPTAFTAGSTASNVTSLDAREAIIRPAGNLVPNAQWGASGTPDEARIRSSTFDQTDNVNWGMGMQMDFQNNNGQPWYPSCDVGTTEAWKQWMCVGNDEICSTSNTDCPAPGDSKEIKYDYAIYLK